MLSLRYARDGVYAKFVLYLLEQAAQCAAAHMQQFAAHIYGGHRLDVVPLHLIAADSAVHRLVGDGGIEQGHDVERLHDVGAVGTCERHIGREVDIAAQRPDARRDGVVRQIAALAVAVEQHKGQRCKLMAGGDAAERDARLLPVAQDGEAEARPVAAYHIELRAARGHLLYEAGVLGRLLIGRVPLHNEGKGGAEASQHFPYLT